jgi:hypothetical protein
MYALRNDIQLAERRLGCTELGGINQQFSSPFTSCNAPARSSGSSVLKWTVHRFRYLNIDAFDLGPFAPHPFAA